MTPTRFGSQVLEVSKGEQSGLLLPYVAVTHDLSPQEYADAVVAKAGLDDGLLHWTRYDCSSWVAGPRRDEAGSRGRARAAEAGS